MKGEKGQKTDPQPAALFHHSAHAFGPLSVTGDAGQHPFFGPAAVAVHDDGEMTGNFHERHHFEFS